MHSQNAAPAKTGEPFRATFHLTLRAKPDIDGVQALRALLKRAPRDHELECVRCQPSTEGEGRS